MPSNNTSRRQTISLDSATTPGLLNKPTPATIDTEFSQVLPAGTKKFLIRSRGSANIKLYFTTGGSEYLTIKKNAAYSENDLNLTATLILYMKSDKTNDVVEILYWT